jgi:hypothetical protein
MVGGGGGVMVTERIGGAEGEENLLLSSETGAQTWAKKSLPTSRSVSALCEPERQSMRWSQTCWMRCNRCCMT